MGMAERKRDNQMNDAQKTLVDEIANVKKEIRDCKKALELNESLRLNIKEKITQKDCLLKKLCRECASYDDNTREMQRQMNQRYGRKGGRNPAFGRWGQE
jgi:hypothetical protein